MQDHVKIHVIIHFSVFLLVTNQIKPKALTNELELGCGMIGLSSVCLFQVAQNKSTLF